MHIADLKLRAASPDLHRGVVDETLNSEFSTGFPLPEHILIPADPAIDEGHINLIGHAMNAAKLERQQAAARLSEIMPDAVEEPPRPEGDDVMGLAVKVLVNVIPELLRPLVTMQGHVEVPAKRAVSSDVIHQVDMS